MLQPLEQGSAALQEATPAREMGRLPTLEALLRGLADSAAQDAVAALARLAMALGSQQVCRADSTWHA